MTRLTTTWLLVAALLVPAPVQAQGKAKPRLSSKKGEKFRYYTVHPGDSCWSIAQMIFGKGEAYRIIHRYNQLGPMPHILLPGQLLRLPAKGTNPEARVDWLHREVRAKSPSTVDWLVARKDMGLWRLYKVRTGSRSSAGIEFDDASQLRMREKALLVIYGAAAARVKLKRRTDTSVMVEQGVVRGGLAALDKDANLRLKTPSAEVALSSKDTRVEVDDKKSSIVSVYDGKAKVKAQGATVEVPKDHGTSVKKGKKPAPPRRLPATPRWDSATGDAVVLVGQGRKGSFSAGWLAVNNAARYQVDVATDASFHSSVVNAEVGAGIVKFQARDLPAGDYYIRVGALDKDKLAGRTSKPVRVRVVELQSSRLLRDGPDKVLEVAGLTRLTVPDKVSKELEISLDGGAFVAGSTPMRLAKRGDHSLAVRLKGSSMTTKLMVRLLSVKAELILPETPLEPGGDPARVSLQLSDERGRPAALPELKLYASTSAEIPFEADGSGQFSAGVPSPASRRDKPVTVVAHWSGGRLAEGELTVKQPPAPAAPAAPPPPKQFPWPVAPAGLVGVLPGPGLPARTVRPVTHFGVLTHAGRRPSTRASAPGDNTAVGFNLRGDLALLDRKLGVDLDVSLLEATVTDEEGNHADLGDVRLGARYLLLDRWGLALAPSLRLVLPTRTAQQSRRGLVLEPALLAEWTLAKVLVLGTQQGVGVDIELTRESPEASGIDGGSTGVTYHGTYDVGFRFFGRLTVGAELATLFTLLRPWHQSSYAAVAAGGVVRMEFDRLRVGLMGGGGINDDGRAVLGKYTVGLTVDVGFPWP